MDSGSSTKLFGDEDLALLHTLVTTVNTILPQQQHSLPNVSESHQ